MSCDDYVMDEELILSTVGDLMDEVRWKREGDAKDRFFVKKGRRLKHFDDVPFDQQPACFQAEHTTTESEVTGMPGKTLLEVNWIIYQAISRDGNAIGAIENNLIVKGVRKALAPKPSDEGYPKRNTLGGLVHHLYIGGKIFKDPGDLDGQGMIVVPIKILVPS